MKRKTSRPTIPPPAHRRSRAQARGYQGKETGEPALFRSLFDCLAPGNVIAEDRYYCSFMMIALLLGRGV